MFKIGDKVWEVNCDCAAAVVKCPDCLGKKFLTVILGDGSQVTIDCAGCSCGYDPPRGYVTFYTHAPRVNLIEIDGLEVRLRYGIEEVEYKAGCRIYYAKNVFATEKEALTRAEELKKKRDTEEAEQMKRKEKPTRTWSWNATYHRRCIRQAEKDLTHHRAKLEAAKLHQKEEEPAPKEG